MAGPKQTPYACLHIDVSPKELLATYASLVRSGDRVSLEAAIARLWGGNRVLVCLSARSALDLYLQARRYLPGSLVLVSAVNIPDISTVLRHHGLVPVPFDIDLATMSPKLLDAEGALRSNRSPSASPFQPRYVAVLLAHLYGRRFDVGPWVSLCRRYGVDLLEDAAEAYSGLSYTGHAEADLSFFSFGSIKAGTAFGGGVCRVRDAVLYERMSMVQRSYPVQQTREYFKKCVKNTAAGVLLNVPMVSGAVMKVARTLHIDHKSMVVAMLRGFPDKLMERLRQQPSLPLLSTLHRRLASFDPAQFYEGTRKGDFMLEKLRSCAFIPGSAALVRNYWLFPLLIEGDRPVDDVLQQLNALGVDAYRGATQLSLVSSPLLDALPDGHAPPPPREARRLMEGVIYLPVHRRVPRAHLERIAAVVAHVLTSTGGREGSGAPAIGGNARGTALARIRSRL